MNKGTTVRRGIAAGIAALLMVAHMVLCQMEQVQRFIQQTVHHNQMVSCDTTLALSAVPSALFVLYLLVCAWRKERHVLACVSFFLLALCQIPMMFKWMKQLVVVLSYLIRSPQTAANLKEFTLLYTLYFLTSFICMVGYVLFAVDGLGRFGMRKASRVMVIVMAGLVCLKHLYELALLRGWLGNGGAWYLPNDPVKQLLITLPCYACLAVFFFAVVQLPEAPVAEGEAPAEDATPAESDACTATEE